VADPQAPPHSSPPCTRTGTASPALGRAAHIRPVRTAHLDIAAISRATARAGNARTDDHRQAIQALREVSACLLRATPQAPDEEMEDTLQAAELAFVELGAYVSRLVGADGYRALVARAVHLAAAEFPFLQAVKPATSPPGRLVGLPKLDASRTTPNQAGNAAVSMLAELLWLLREFLGRDLIQRVVVLVWPSLAKAGASARTKPRAYSG
jgi:hypothetical protein